MLFLYLFCNYSAVATFTREPLKTFSPIFEKVSQMEKYKDVEFVKIDTDDTNDEGEEIIAKFVQTHTQ